MTITDWHAIITPEKSKISKFLLQAANKEFPKLMIFPNSPHEIYGLNKRENWMSGHIWELIKKGKDLRYVISHINTFSLG